MELEILSRNIELDARAEAYARKKFGRLERHLPSISSAKLEISGTSARSRSDRVVAQVTLNASGNVLRGQERDADLYAVIDAVADVMDRQISRYKGRVYRIEQAKRARKTGPPSGQEPDVPIMDDEAERLERPAVVRAKRFEMKPMAVEDAIMQMEMLSHQFFLFHNSDTNEYNVVYRRHDGDYGIIGPELA